MLKQNVDEIWKEYPYKTYAKFRGELPYVYPQKGNKITIPEEELENYEWYEVNETDYPHEEPNIKCDCGNNNFKVCWWDYPHTGGFCKIICSECGKELVLIDDYS